MQWLFAAVLLLTALKLLDESGLLRLIAGAWSRLFGEAWIGFAVLASALWGLVLAGGFHEEHHAKARGAARRGGMLMDILDRLTNRRVLEDRIAEMAEPALVDADALTILLKARVVGQDQVCDDVARQIRRRMALQQRTKPIGVFLLAGPPGTGKTYFGKVLAELLHRKLVHIDMTMFARGTAAATSLFGSSKGYVGSDSYGSLTAALRDHPDAVVLLDEFEKADAGLHKNFLTAWNDGFIIEASDGRKVATSGAIFLLTTNAATAALSELVGRSASDTDDMRRAAIGVLNDAHFAPEVLSRIDRIFVFRPLVGLNQARVAALEIEAMISQYGLEVAEGGIDPEILLATLKDMRKLGETGSVRDLVRAIEERLGEGLIQARTKGWRRVRIESVEGEVVVRSVDAAAPRTHPDPAAS